MHFYYICKNTLILLPLCLNKVYYYIIIIILFVRLRDNLAAVITSNTEDKFLINIFIQRFGEKLMMTYSLLREG